MAKYFILGIGSKLYKKIKMPGMKGCSTQEFFSGYPKISEEETIVVFSLLNKQQLIQLSNMYLNNIIVVGSSAAISKLANRFNYSKLKKKQLETIKHINRNNIKYLIFGEFYPSSIRKGLYYFTSPDSFWRYCFDANSSNNAVLHCYEIKGNISKLTNFLSKIDLIFAPISSYILKTFTSYTYGYVNAANKEE